MIPEYNREKPDYMKSRKELETSRNDIWKTQQQMDNEIMFRLAYLMIFSQYNK